jgi:PAS domain-containing protein
VEALPGVGGALADRLQAALDKNIVFNTEFTLKSGTAPFGTRHFLAQFYLLAPFYRLDVAQGENARAGFEMVEITERKLDEEKLRRSEERHRDVVEHSMYGV